MVRKMKDLANKANEKEDDHHVDSTIGAVMKELNNMDNAWFVLDVVLTKALGIGAYEYVHLFCHIFHRAEILMKRFR